ncbi:MAG: hypothetical protein WC269_04350 [Candidatus Gracilibacteria bacterium]|jgi:hypothetical protein
MKKVVLPGILAGVLMLIVGMGINYLMNLFVPALMVEYTTSGLFRPWEDPLMSLYFAYPIVLGLALAWFWNKTKSSFKGASVFGRGASFGFACFLIATIPGMLVTYASFDISLGMVLSWTLMGIVDLLIAGFVFAKLNK